MKSATNTKNVALKAGWACKLPVLLRNEPDRSFTGFAECPFASAYFIVHDAGQTMLAAKAGIEKRSGYDTGRSGLVTMATLW